jgi:hypothetical protein
MENVINEKWKPRKDQLKTTRAGTDVLIKKKHFAEKFGEKIVVFGANKRQLCRKSNRNIVF